MRFIKHFLLMMFIPLISVPIASHAGEYDFGTAGVRGLSVEKEKELGDYFITVARSQLPVIYDPALEQYLKGIIGRMAAQSNGVKYPFDAFFVEDQTLNAAAFFGGKIMVNSGLITSTDSESEFAGVLAHEMTHVTQRHIARSLEAQNDASNVGIAGIVGSLILAVINPAVAMAAMSASINGVQQSVINYTRSHEEEADRIGIDLLYRSGFNPNGMANMFRKLRRNEDKINPAFEMLLTHPLSEKRVAEAENRARGYHPKKYYESIDFAFAKSRMLARYSKTSKSYLKSEAKRVVNSSADNYGAWYLLALVSVDTKDLAEAKKALDILNKKYSSNLFVIDTMTDYYLVNNEKDRARQMLENLNVRMPNNEVIIVNLANVYLSQSKTDKAIQLLRRLKRNMDSVTGNELLMKAYRKNKDTCNMYQLNAEILEYRGVWDQAIMNADSALRVCKNKNDVLKTRAMISRITSEQAFYKDLLDK